MADPTSYTRPVSGDDSDYPQWATDTDPASAIIAPTDAKKGKGWIVEVPPHETFNWWMNNVYKWVQYLDKRSYVYDSVYDAVNGMDSSDRETAFINSYDPTKAPLEELWDKPGDETITALAADGKFVYVGYTESGPTAYKVQLINPKNGAVFQTYTASAAVNDIYSDGEVLVIAAGDTVSALAVPTSTTTSLSFFGSWAAVYDHGAQVNSVYSDGNIIVMGGVTSGSKTIKTINRSTGALVNSADTTATVNGVISDGTNIYSVGDDTPSTDLTVLKWNYTLGTSSFAASISATDDATCVAVGRDIVAVGYASGKIYVYDKVLSSQVWSLTSNEDHDSINSIAIFNGVVWASGPPDAAGNIGTHAGVVGYDERSGKVVYHTDLGINTGSTHVDIKAIATDGASLFVGGTPDDESTKQNTWGLYVPVKLSLIQRMVGSERYRSPLHIACEITPTQFG